MDNIRKALEKQFQKHRIVFWYDAKEELREEYEAVDLPDVEKIEIDGNEFGVKHRILREEPEEQFLLYHQGPAPDPIDNWLLDVQLAHGQFKADQISLWLSEVGLGPEYWEVASDHRVFFDAKARNSALKDIVDGKESAVEMKRKMVAVCSGSSSSPRMDSILENLLHEEAQDSGDAMHLIERCELEEFLWEEIEKRFGYQVESPTIRDLAIDLFQSSYALGLGEDAPLPSSIQAFMKRWKDSREHSEAFEILSEEYADILEIKEDLADREAQDLVDVDTFRIIDQKILSDLVKQVLERTISASACENLIWKRRNTHWYDEFEDMYQAIYYGSQFLVLLEKTELSVRSLEDGFQKYINTWYKLDQQYRKFIYHARASKQISLLEGLMEDVENHYSNNYLLEVNDRWQQAVDQSASWKIADVIPQDLFYDHFVKGKFLRQDKKVVVIISDALRYEIGLAFADRIRGEDRYNAEVDPMVSTLPSATQMGMAALLPHENIRMDKDGGVSIDGQSTQGTQNRREILAEALSGEATALQASDLLNMNKEESRVLFRDHELIYIYHNQIDAIGDDRTTEEQACKAAQDAIQELVDIVKKLTNANATNLLVTADHGFIYQDRALDESDFVHLEDLQGEIYHQKRRWILGEGKDLSPRLKRFSPGALGYEGEADLHLAKSINRLRVKGAGSRYVHGGAALQEVVLPVIWINKQRESDIDVVEVDILGKSSSVISTGQVSVSFYQQDPVSPKCKPRKLIAGIYAKDGTLISNEEELSFDLEAEEKREREVKETFVLSHKAEEYNGQEVYLKLKERVPRTKRYKDYKTMRFKLQRAFTSDFDF